MQKADFVLSLAEKIGLLLGLYGAVLSTVNTIIQFTTQRKDRVNVLVTVRPNMVSTDAMHKRMTVVTATNRGKRPVRIEGFAASQLDTDLHIMFLDVRPQVPYQLNESQSISAYIPIDYIYGDLKEVDTYFAYDSINRNFKCHVKPWYRRYLSYYRRRLSRRMV
ncbi:MAG TPA: hypothetical protein VFS41_04810 [Edaphobacter sp.]|nr:hypothetical protein [Edaphobacter sp.]